MAKHVTSREVLRTEVETTWTCDRCGKPCNPEPYEGVELRSDDLEAAAERMWELGRDNVTGEPYRAALAALRDAAAGDRATLRAEASRLRLLLHDAATALERAVAYKGAHLAEKHGDAEMLRRMRDA